MLYRDYNFGSCRMKSGRSLIRKRRVFASRLFVVGLLCLIMISGSQWQHKGIWGTLLFLTGLVMVGAATVGRLWCSIYISGYKNDFLITTGPYSLCRNPLYFFSLLGAVGVGLATETFTLAALVVLGFAAYYPFVIRAEQGHLAAIHGETYGDYCRKTPMFFPRLTLFSEPGEYTVKSAVLRKRLIDSLGFIWIVVLLELIEAFHDVGVLPQILRLY
jgi:protein-S-isoprenylcysteine O-methyltransferase Ste14